MDEVAASGPAFDQPTVPLVPLPLAMPLIDGCDRSVTDIP